MADSSGGRALTHRHTMNAGTARLPVVASIVAVGGGVPFAIAGGPSRLGFFMEVASSAAETALTRGYALVLVPPLDALPSLDELDIGWAVVVEPRRADEVTPQPRESTLAAQREYDAFTTRSDMVHRLVLVDEAEGEEGAHRRMTELLGRSPQVDGVCAMVDTFATGVIRAIRESGRSVPGDVRVVTRYDGIRARTSEPQLTAVDLHLDETAAAAVELLLRVLSGEDTATPGEVALPVLVPRASSAVVTPLAR